MQSSFSAFYKAYKSLVYGQSSDIQAWGGFPIEIETQISKLIIYIKLSCFYIIKIAKLYATDYGNFDSTQHY